jgi:hypothetical protein
VLVAVDESKLGGSVRSAGRDLDGIKLRDFLVGPDSGRDLNRGGDLCRVAATHPALAAAKVTALLLFGFDAACYPFRWNITLLTMNRSLKTLLVVCLLTSTAWAGANPFIGDWKLDPSKSRMPDEMKVQSQGGNKYAFDFGGATETIVVDGTDQPGYGGTTLSVKAEAPDTWIVERKKDGRSLLKATWKLSKDSNTLTDYYRQGGSDGSTLSMDYVYQRTGEGSGFAADWQSIEETMNTPFVMQVKQFEADGLSFISQHTTKNVKADGKDYPNEGQGAAQGATSSMQRVDDRALVITDKANGKVTATKDVALSADLKTLTMTVHVAGGDKPTVMVFERS